MRDKYPMCGKQGFGTLLLGLMVAMMLGSCQDTFVYHPVREGEQEMLQKARELGLEPWPNEGESRIGWRGAAVEEPRHRVVIFHGNGGHALHRGYLVDGLTAVEDGSAWEVYLLDYPGYGSRAGRPSQETLVQAGQEIVDLLLEVDSTRPVFLIGESLGSGVAAQVAASRAEAVPGVLLITPFTNLEDVGASMFPRFLVRALLQDRYDAEKALASYDGRVGVLLAGEDDVVPPELGRRLYNSVETTKRLWVQEGAGHNTLDYSPAGRWWRDMTRFLTEGA